MQWHEGIARPVALAELGQRYPKHDDRAFARHAHADEPHREEQNGRNDHQGAVE